MRGIESFVTPLSIPSDGPSALRQALATVLPLLALVGSLVLFDPGPVDDGASTASARLEVAAGQVSEPITCGAP